MVIPPGNFSTSKRNVGPNKDVFKRNDWYVTRYTKVSLIKLSEVVNNFDDFGYGSTPNTTLVTFDPAKDSRDKITTWFK